MSLIKRRGGHRTMAINLIKTLWQIIASDSIDCDELNIKVKMLVRQRDQILDLDKDIQDNLDEDEILKDMEEAQRRLEEIETCLLKVNKITHAPSSSQANVSKVPGIRLPTINLPKFDGNLLEWSHFWDIFKSSVDNRQDISKAQKFSYLTGQLIGEAGKILKGFTSSDADYDEAIKLLSETYGDEGRIINAHLYAIFDLKSPSSNADDLGRFRSQYECHVRALRTLGTKIDDGGFIIASLLARKLPTKVRDRINRSIKNQVWNLQEFRDAINEEIRMLQAMEPEEEFHSEKSKTIKNKVKCNDLGDEVSSTVGNFSINTNQVKRFNKCHLCSEDHPFYLCSTYKTPEEKSKRTRELKLCNVCLKGKHFAVQCFNKSNCRICNGRHNTALCLRDKKEASTKSNAAENIPVSTTAIMHSKSSANISNGIALPTAMLKIKVEDSFYSVRALFDQGSQKTFILKSVTSSLQLKSNGNLMLAVDGFESKGQLKNYDMIQFIVLAGNEQIKVEALSVDNLPTRLTAIGLSEAINKLKKLKVKLADPEVSDSINGISIIIGADMYYKFVRGLNTYDGINVISSKIGGMISGVLPHNETFQSLNEAVVTVLKVSEQPSELKINLEKVWNLDSIGMDGGIIATKDEEILREFRRNLKFNNNQYETALPWKKDHPTLRSNFALAANRLRAVLRKLRSDDNLVLYNEILSDQLTRGFIEKIDPLVDNLPGAKIHYLAHHGVKKNSKTTPLRIVFDCSAGNPSLNSCLHTGPSMVNDLVQILLRFRQGQFACTSDIAKAYLMISLRNEDRDATRFLWPKDPFKQESALETYRFKVVLFGATCSQFLLNACIEHHLEMDGTPTSKYIQRNLYIDNLQSTSDSEQGLLDHYYNSRRIMSSAGFNLREWETNSDMLRRELGSNDGETKQFTSLLGLSWNIKEDLLSFPMKKISTEFTTMREVLSGVASVFDPLGFLSPVVISARIFMQTLWKAKLSWDEKIPENLLKMWRIVAEDLMSAMTISIPRVCIHSSSIQLHAFSDASIRAYGVVIYFVSGGRSQIIMSKARVAPVKNMTIPQLELTAATLAARLTVYVINTFREEVNFDKINMWTDSQIVLHWINNGKQNIKPYVARRLNEIRELLPTNKWMHVPSEDNPADLVSRGISSEIFKRSVLWFNGPTWITKESEWPIIGIIKPSEIHDVAKVMVNVSDENNSHFQDDIFQFVRLGSFKKLLKVVVLVKRYISNLKKKNDGKNLVLSDHFVNHNIDLVELEAAEDYVIQTIQKQEYKEIVQYLVDDCGKKCPNIIRQLNLFLHMGIIRCRGRLELSELNFNSKNPILLPSNHYVTHLIISQFHVRYFHAGINSLIGHLRSVYWIPRIRQVVSGVIKGCTFCKRLNVLQYKTPPSPPLPADRVIESRPFSICGVDYTGALMVKDSGITRKTYIALFTCALTRALHLELVDDNSCEAFLRAFRRFTSRRATPRVMYSDNAQNFKSASNLLRKWQQHPSIKNFLLEGRLTWKFIPVRAPWFGGFWERLVGMTKESIRKILGRSLVTIDELRTIIVEVEMVLNDRPLTYSSEKSPEEITPLTPSQLICGYRIGDSLSAIDLVEEELFLDRDVLNRRQKKCVMLLQKFWKRWHREYLLSLRERHSALRAKKTGMNEIQVGDVVLIFDESRRINWKMGHILQLHPGQDGHVRSATLQTANGTTCRPVARLYPLEINDSNFLRDLHKIHNIEKKPPKPQRKAATDAGIAIAQQLQDSD